jgi:hypothetical protein
MTGSSTGFNSFVGLVLFHFNLTWNAACLFRLSSSRTFFFVFVNENHIAALFIKIVIDHNWLLKLPALKTSEDTVAVELNLIQRFRHTNHIALAVRYVSWNKVQELKLYLWCQLMTKNCIMNKVWRNFSVCVEANNLGDGKERFWVGERIQCRRLWKRT